MKFLVLTLTALFLDLQCKLWLESSNIRTICQLKQQTMVQQHINMELSQGNAVLEEEIQDLKRGRTTLEEHARNDLGLIKSDEVFYQVVNNTKN